MGELWGLLAGDVADLTRSKKVSATEAASAALARLDAVNPKINAVVDHRPQDVLAQAAAVDAAIARNEDWGHWAAGRGAARATTVSRGLAPPNGLKRQRTATAATTTPGGGNLGTAAAVIPRRPI